MKDHIDNIGMTPSRRQFVLGALSAVIAAPAMNAIASSKGHEHHHHHQGAHQYEAIIKAALDCVQKGQLCRDHCIELVKKGDTSISDCLDAVIDTIAMCETLSQLAVSNSKHLKAFANVCIQVCQDCEKECRVHADHHKECQACMTSCEHCIKELKAIAA